MNLAAPLQKPPEAGFVGLADDARRQADVSNRKFVLPVVNQFVGGKGTTFSAGHAGDGCEIEVRKVYTTGQISVFSVANLPYAL
jgi:hypothetical protein